MDLTERKKNFEAQIMNIDSQVYNLLEMKKTLVARYNELADIEKLIDAEEE